MPETKIRGGDGLPDLRLPVGIFFVVVAVILLAQWRIGGTPTDMPAIAANADRDWGIVLLIFGALMTTFGARAAPQRITDDTAEIGGGAHE